MTVFYIISAPMLEFVLSRRGPLLLIGLSTVVLTFPTLLSLSEGKVFTWQVYPMVALGAGVVLAAQLSRVQKISLAALFSMSVFVSFCFRGSGTQTVFPNYPSNLEQRAQLLENVVAVTGWNYDVFRERAYFVGNQREHDFSIIYEQEFKKQRPNLNVNIDGVLIVHNSFAKFFEELNGEQKPNWAAVSQLIPRVMYSAGTSGGIQCKTLHLAGDFQICYYAFSQKRPLKWNNLGYPYRSLAETNPFRADQRRGVRVLDSNSAILYLNICSNLEDDCTIFFKVIITPEQFVRLEITGMPVAVPDPAVNPAWVAAIEDLTIEIDCKNQKPKTFEALTLLGFSDDRYTRDRVPNFLAPVQLEFPLACKSPSNIAIRSKPGHSFFNNYIRRPLPRIYLEWKRI